MKNAVQLFTIFVLGFAFLPATAQQILLEKHWPEEYQIAQTLPTADGFLVLGAREREEKIGHYIHTYKTPFVTRLDHAGKQLWLKKFPESKFMYLSEVKANGDGIYIIGERHDHPVKKRTAAQFIQLNWAGKVVRQKAYHYPAHHSVEGKHLELLPDGDLIVMHYVYRDWGSNGEPWIVRMSPEGQRRWERRPKDGNYYVGTEAMQVTGNGELAVFGCVYPNREFWDAEKHKAWFVTLDLKTGLTKQEKQLDNHHRLYFKRVIELGNGGWWVLAQAKVQNQRKIYSVLLELSPELEIVNEEEIHMEKGIMPLDFDWNAHEGELMVTSTVDPYHSRKAGFLSIGTDWSLRADPKQTDLAILDLHAFETGEYLAVDRRGFRVMR